MSSFDLVKWKISNTPKERSWSKKFDNLVDYSIVESRITYGDVKNGKMNNTTDYRYFIKKVVGNSVSMLEPYPLGKTSLKYAMEDVKMDYIENFTKFYKIYI